VRAGVGQLRLDAADESDGFFCSARFGDGADEARVDDNGFYAGFLGGDGVTIGHAEQLSPAFNAQRISEKRLSF
jgi:hypothetical protein